MSLSVTLFGSHSMAMSYKSWSWLIKLGLNCDWYSPPSPLKSTLYFIVSFSTQKRSTTLRVLVRKYLALICSTCTCMHKHSYIHPHAYVCYVMFQVVVGVIFCFGLLRFVFVSFLLLFCLVVVGSGVGEFLPCSFVYLSMPTTCFSECDRQKRAAAASTDFSSLFDWYAVLVAIVLLLLLLLWQ